MATTGMISQGSANNTNLADLAKPIRSTQSTGSLATATPSTQTEKYTIQPFQVSDGIWNTYLIDPNGGLLSSGASSRTMEGAIQNSLPRFESYGFGDNYTIGSYDNANPFDPVAYADAKNYADYKNDPSVQDAGSSVKTSIIKGHYQEILDREPTPQEYDYWISKVGGLGDIAGELSSGADNSWQYYDTRMPIDWHLQYGDQTREQLERSLDWQINNDADKLMGYVNTQMDQFMTGGGLKTPSVQTVINQVIDGYMPGMHNPEARQMLVSAMMQKYGGGQGTPSGTQQLPVNDPSVPIAPVNTPDPVAPVNTPDVPVTTPDATTPTATDITNPDTSDPIAPATQNSVAQQDYSLSQLQGLLASMYQPQTREVQANETVQGQLNSILDANSPLMQRAAAEGRAYASSRGLLNSSLAAEASQGAMIDRAAPIAAQDAGVYASQALANQGFQNQFGLSNNQFLQSMYSQDDQQNFISGESALDRAQQTNLQTLAQQFNASQAELDRAQQILIADKNISAENALQQARLDVQVSENELDRQQQTSITQMDQQFRQGLLQTELDARSSENALDREQQSTLTGQTTMANMYANLAQYTQSIAAAATNDINAIEMDPSLDQATKDSMIAAVEAQRDLDLGFSDSISSAFIEQIQGLFDDGNISF